MTDEQPDPPTTDDPMPVFPLLAKDDLAPRIVLAYATSCWANGLREQAAQVELAIDEIGAWRRRHPDLCHLPDHEHVPVTASPDATRTPGSGALVTLTAYREELVDTAGRVDELERVIRRVLERHATIADQRLGRGTLCEADERELREAIRSQTDGPAAAEGYTARELLSMDPGDDNRTGRQIADEVAARLGLSTGEDQTGDPT